MSKGALGMLAAYWPEDTPRYAHIPLKTVTDVTISAGAQAAPEAPALVIGDHSYSYAELASRITKIAGAIRARCQRGARLALELEDPLELITASFGAFEAEVLSALSTAVFDDRALSAFAPELIIGEAGGSALPAVAFNELISAEGKERSGRPDFRSPILALANSEGTGEVLHNHRSLVATSIAVGSFFMIEKESRVALLEPPTSWHSLALMLGVFQRGGTVWCAWGKESMLPDKLDYVLCGWDRAGRFLDKDSASALPSRVGAGVIVAIEAPFSLSRRRRIARHLKVPILTMLGRNELGPVMASHPTWFLDEAAGIPLPNVDTRPINPADRTPLSIGWDAVESAEIGVRSALAPAGGSIIDGWLRSGIIAEVDPTGLYFLRPTTPLRSV